MSLTTSKQLLLDAQAGGYALAAFNVENLEMMMAVIAGAEAMESPVILQTTPSTLRYAGAATFGGAAAALAKKAKVPLALHLDHGNSLALVREALEAGYTSIMIDGSKLPLDENIALTRAAAALCRERAVPVEGEIGQVGGKEDDTHCEDAGYTLPHEAVAFEQDTGLDSMAVGVGTAHGVYAVAPVLNVELISTLKDLISVPLVLHGASGLSDRAVRDCVSRGICKVNFATELRMAYSDGVKECLQQNPEVFDPKVYGKSAMKRVKALVMEKIRLCGCNGRI